MAQSRLIELSYYDPAAQVRLSAYADTVVLDHNSKGGIISAVRFGGYPEMVRAMSDAIYGGATIEATQNSTTRMLQSNVKGYQRQMSHDGVYAVATLMASDDAQTDDRASKGDGDGDAEGQELRNYLLFRHFHWIAFLLGGYFWVSGFSNDQFDKLKNSIFEFTARKLTRRNCRVYVDGKEF